MGLLSGSISVTRFNLAPYPDAPDFERAAFREIAAGSEVRESVGFIPYEPEAPYEVGARRYAFRIRIDKLRPDPTAVKERLKELEKTELEMSGLQFIGPKKRKELRHLAEEELIVRQAPSSRIIECCIDGQILYVGSTAKSLLGTVVLLLRRIGIEAAFKTPWADQGLPETFSELVETQDESESVWGARFLKALIGDPDFLVEPEAGKAKLATREARVTLTGGILGDLHRYLEKCEVLSLKLLTGDVSFTLEGLSFRVTGLRLPPARTEHWTEDLDERLTQIQALYEKLEEKFGELGGR